jgi:hypothetical protein
LASVRSQEDSRKFHGRVSFHYDSYLNSFSEQVIENVECSLRQPGVFLVECQIVLESKEVLHCVAVDTLQEQVSDSLVEHLQKFHGPTFWKRDSLTRIRNVVHIYQIMKVLEQ